MEDKEIKFKRILFAVIAAGILATVYLLGVEDGKNKLEKTPVEKAEVIYAKCPNTSNYSNHPIITSLDGRNFILYFPSEGTTYVGHLSFDNTELEWTKCKEYK